MLRTAFATVLLLGLAACGGGDRPAEDPDSSARSSTGGQTGSPAVVDPVVGLLDWKDTGHSAEQRVVVGAEWRVVVDAAGRRAVLEHADEAGLTITAAAGRRISEVLLDDDWAVVVQQDKPGNQPSRAEWIDLDTMTKRNVTTPEPAGGGSWALTDGNLYYPTYGQDSAYCLATLALADSNGEDGWCAPDRTGWSGLTASDAGVGMLRFDDTRPVACRTVNLLDASGVPQHVDGPPDCTAWDVAATADGVAWSTVPKPRRQEEAHFYASANGEHFDLGPGTTGSLVPCGDSVFFVRDPKNRADPARLMRWSDDQRLEVAYESASTGDAFLGEPTCARDVLTLSSFGAAGDEQVWAAVS